MNENYHFHNEKKTQHDNLLKIYYIYVRYISNKEAYRYKLPMFSLEEPFQEDDSTCSTHKASNDASSLFVFIKCS